MSKWEYKIIRLYYSKDYSFIQNNLVTNSSGQTAGNVSRTTIMLGEGWYHHKDNTYTQPVELDQILMFFGQEGWELINALQGNNDTIARLIFKRLYNPDQPPTIWPNYDSTPVSRESRPPH